MTRAVALSLALLVTSATAAQAEEVEWLAGFKPADALVRECSGSASAECLSYLQAVADSAIATRMALQLLKRPYGPPCFHEGMNGYQLIGAFQRFVSLHPEKVTLNAYGLVLAAYQDAFPCH